MMKQSELLKIINIEHYEAFNMYKKMQKVLSDDELKTIKQKHIQVIKDVLKKLEKQWGNKKYGKVSSGTNYYM